MCVCVCVNQQNKCKNTKFDNLSRALYLLTLIAATEYRNWLMYYSLPCMKGILDEEYYQHYSLLVGGITFLSGRSISPEQLEMADMLLRCMVLIMVSEEAFCVDTCKMTTKRP